jgi:16S rRNA (cytosine967-C5)-methyltransferase
MHEDPRAEALYILNSLNDDGSRTLDAVMDDLFRTVQGIDRRNRALLNTLVFGVLRWRKRLDWIIGRFSSTPLDKIEPGILNVLRLGAYQIVYLDRIPVSAAVNTSVELSKSLAKPWVVRFVNAVLRRLSREYEDVLWPDPDKDPLKALSVDKSLPEWLLERWLDRFGWRETESLCDAVNQIPPITVRTNRLKVTRQELLALLTPEVEEESLTPYAPDGISFFKPKRPVAELSASRSGYCQVQDEAAQLVSCLLNPQPGELILDACAGRGGKTGHIAQLMGNKGRIVALDRDESKLKQIDATMQRLGIFIVKAFVHDLRHRVGQRLPSRFDRILVDAPCSGLGVIRRNPDTRWFVFKQNLNRYQKMQIGILKNLAGHVKVNGKLVYAVCSFEPEENEAVIETFLRRHGNFVVDTDLGDLSPRHRAIAGKKGYFSFYPHIHSMDGFFSVRLMRVA